jgi:hypothetical protein
MQQQAGEPKNVDGAGTVAVFTLADQIERNSK